MDLLQGAGAAEDPYAESSTSTPVDLAAIARAVLPVPDAFQSSTAAARAEHRDLAAMSDADLWREGERSRLRIVLDPEPVPWVLERFRAVEAERARRRERGVRAARGGR